ncbi:MAG: zinc metalloprotease [Candidatus Handelsmanbacteria bacterium RIFCSPLOWO2_12_FULL_64_10]|uniref:Zinc metalloprotease n=1 Tax=Handelsmanbacteria sp. (strain RIFCSPLOWO2_12_FULL_64_10) TaxID=1817868 RepID=A0A1F6D2J4_HANXR|nr:MAG: zinc metalloprotease [Candidatus Handelsmanbacteria bacterium RIFCSPLOWO2_12_FULL_64_10]
MELSYSVRRSARRKTLTITVERDRSVVVHAPSHASDEAIQRVVESRRQWIFSKLHHAQKYQELPHPPGKELVSGESALYLGRSYRIEVVADGSGEIEFAHRFMIPASHAMRRKGAMREWYLARANEKILPRVERHAHALGVEFKRARIVDNRYRWGSCTVHDNVTFNWRLIKAPIFVIDYVIVHELAHLIEANHNPRFWNVVRTHVPRMEKARAWLNENGQVLEEEI